MWIENRLKCIVFCIESICVDADEKNAYVKLKDMLTGLGYTVCENVLHIADAKLDARTTLLITDNETVAKVYVMKGYAVAGYEADGMRRIPSAAYVFERMQDVSEDDLLEMFCRMQYIPKHIMDTERCYIREIALEDIPRLYEMYANPSITEYMEPLFEKPEDELSYTKSYIRNVYGLYGYGMWVLVLKENETVIGRIGIEMKGNPLDEGVSAEECRGGVELGFMIAAQYQRKGYAKEAIRAVLAYCRENMDSQPVYAMVEKDNEASKRLCEKMGFTHIKTLWQNGRNFCYFEYENN